ncbi:MAG: membrane protein insertion efficiency factor YidD [Alphaproteobacteria bacterium]|nr:membrane protein insertion efficiency factor YidD [Alphaproteobacteria bacterium]
MSGGGAADRLNPAQRLALGLIFLYRVTLSSLMGRQCRFLPTCSEYAADAVRAHGALRGAWLALKRIARCHPWGGSGYDPVPPRRD